MPAAAPRGERWRATPPRHSAGGPIGRPMGRPRRETPRMACGEDALVPFQARGSRWPCDAADLPSTAGARKTDLTHGERVLFGRRWVCQKRAALRRPTVPAPDCDLACELGKPAAYHASTPARQRSPSPAPAAAPARPDASGQRTQSADPPAHPSRALVWCCQEIERASPGDIGLGRSSPPD